MTNQEKPTIGIFGISGCAGCLLTFLYLPEFKDITKLLDIKSYPLIKENTYKGKFDYIFVEGTVCFNQDVKRLKEFRKRANKIIALGACSCFGGVPSMKNFLNQEKTMRFVYPTHNKLKSTPPEPINKYIKVDYYLPQCPPSKTELAEFIKCILSNKPFKPYTDPVCFECRKNQTKCLLEKNELCLGPITNGGCNAICPANNTECYGCRGPCEDANFKAFIDMLKQKGYNQKQIQDKIQIFAGLQFKELAKKKHVSTWLEG